MSRELLSGQDLARIRHNRDKALPTLLPLLEAHIDPRMVPRPQWVSGPEPARPRWPEPLCSFRCPECPLFKAGCKLRDEPWHYEWRKLRRRFPQLRELESLLATLGQTNPHWASALYWVHVQPWDLWNPAKRDAWEWEGRNWLAVSFRGWLPVYVPDGLPPEDPDDELTRAVIRMRVQRQMSFRQIARSAGTSKSTVGRILSAAGVD